MKSLCLIALESNANLPDLAAREDGRSSCLVKFCWFGITAQAGRVVEFMQLSRRALNQSFW